MVKHIKEKIRNCFIAGLIAVVPLAFILYVIDIMLASTDGILKLIPGRYNPQNYIPFPLPGLGAILVLGGILLIGLFVTNYVGRHVVVFGERIVYQIPLVRPLYAAIKQLLEAIFSQSYKGFQRVVLIEYPRRGIYAVAFVTGVASPEVQELMQERFLNVFMPKTPNPTTGFFILMPEKDVIPISMSVEEAFKLIISGGLVSPVGDRNRSNRPPIESGQNGSDKI